MPSIVTISTLAGVTVDPDTPGKLTTPPDALALATVAAIFRGRWVCPLVLRKAKSPLCE